MVPETDCRAQQAHTGYCSMFSRSSMQVWCGRGLSELQVGKEQAYLRLYKGEGKSFPNMLLIGNAILR
jgi:hypothetical protein